MFKLFWIWNWEDETELELLDSENVVKENEIGQVALDIIEKWDSIVIIAPIAGIDIDDIELSVNKTVLTISWKRNKPDVHYEWNIIRNSECFWGPFLRNVILPENMDFDSIKAIMENNLLIINIPKLNFDTKSIKISKVQNFL